MTLQSTLTQLAIAIVILNAVSNGWLLSELTANLQGQFGVTAAQTAECTFAIMYARPTANVFGMDVPIPTGDDVALSLALFSIFYFGVYRPPFKYAVAMLVVLWLIIRYAAISFATSVPGCMELVNGASQITSMFYWVSVIMVPILILRYLKK
jgi:hypothetical protein